MLETESTSLCEILVAVSGAVLKLEVGTPDSQNAKRYRKSTIKPPSQISPLLLICTLLLCRVENLPRLY